MSCKAFRAGQQGRWRVSGRQHHPVGWQGRAVCKVYVTSEACRFDIDGPEDIVFVEDSEAATSAAGRSTRG